MRGPAAYAMFVLACALPGWLLRDIVAAEAQLHKPVIRLSWDIVSIGRGGLTLPAMRKLGPTGQEYLRWVLRTGPDGIRRSRARALFTLYGTPTGGR